MPPPTLPDMVRQCVAGTHPTSLDLEHFYRSQRSCTKVVFLHVCVILSTGEGGVRGMGGMRGRGACVVMGGVRAQVGGMHGGGGACVPPRPYEIWFVNARPVPILLECILLNSFKRY